MENPGKRNIIALISFGVASSAFIYVLPLIVGGLSDHLAFSEAQSGRIVSCELWGVMMATVLAALTIHRWKLRTAAITGGICILFANSVAAFSTTFLPISLMCLLAGFGGGVIWCSLTASISSMKKPESMFGLLFAGMSLFGAIGLFTLPYIFKWFSMKGAFLILAFLPIPAFLFAIWFPARSSKSKVLSLQGKLLPLFGWSIVLSLVSYALMETSLSGVWAYMDRIAVARGLTVEKIGTGLALSEFGGLIGALTAARIGTRYGRCVPIFIGVGMMAVCASFFMGQLNMTIFICISFVLAAMVSFTIPFYLGIYAAADPSGRMVAVGNIVSAAGIALGPAVASLLVGDTTYRTLLLAVIAGLCISMLLVVSASRKQRTA